MIGKRTKTSSFNRKTNPKRPAQVIPRSKAFALIVSTCILIAGQSLVQGQTPQAPLLNSVSNQTQPPVPGVGHDYQHLLGETVNYSNGSVSFKIAFPVAKGRGITLPFTWSYNSAAANPLDSVDGHTPVWDNPSSHSWPQKDGWNVAEGIPTATVQVWTVPAPSTVQGGPTYIPCNYQSGMTFTDESGVGHNLYGQAFAPAFTNSSDQQLCTAFTQPPSGDGQVIATLNPSTSTSTTSLSSLSPASGSFSVMDKNGTSYAFPGGYNTQSEGVLIWPTEVTDRNGNYISLGGTQGVIDTMGRAMPQLSGFPTGTGASTVTLTVNPPATNPSNVDELTFTSIWTTESASYPVNAAGGHDAFSGTGIGCGSFPSTVTGTRNILSSLILPNGQKYSFYYGMNTPSNDHSVGNSFGLLNTIIFPDGGWITYSWQLPAQAPGWTSDSQYNEMASMGGITFSVQNAVYVPNPVPFGCNWQYQSPVLLQRQVSFDGSTVAQTQSYSLATAWQYASDGAVNGWTNKQATVTTTDNIRNLTSKAIYTYTPYAIPAQPLANSGIATTIPLEHTITYYDWGQATKLKSVAKQWYDQFNLASEITTVYTSGSPRVAGTIFGYRNNLCSSSQFLFPFTSTVSTSPVQSLVYLTEQDDYDFGNGALGPLTKKTLYNYNCFPGQFPNSAPPVQTLPPQVSSVTIEDGTGAIKAATQYSFDVSGLTTITATNNSQGYSAVRGNVNSIRRCNPLPATWNASCSSGPTTTFAYDTTGQPTMMLDPNSNRTGFSFADSFTDHTSTPGTNAYLTAVTYPDALQEKFTYSYWLGYLTGSIDKNNNPTGYVYNTPNSSCTGADGNLDGMDRLSEMDYPNGGKTIYCYNDTLLTTTKKVLLASPSNWMVNLGQFDGMGHTTRTQLTSDPDGVTTVDTALDGEGKVYYVSNPYRTAPTPKTYLYYDGLGRTVQTTEQDGNVQQWCFNGIPSSVAPSTPNCNGQVGSVASTRHPGKWVDFTDERGDDWQRTSDYFGNLSEVMEPNGVSQTASMETDYLYDTLNNLTSVAQYGGSHGTSGSRMRAFQYDGLSELQTAFNPETGMVWYTYDANGNVLTRTDARGVITQYAYDGLNRMLAKTYMNDITGTPAACYQYGLSSESSVSTGGRLINAWTQTSQNCNYAPSLGSYLTLRAIQSYSKIGGLTSEYQYTPANQATGKVYAPQYTYDLAGNLFTSTDGITPSPTSSGNLLTFTNTVGGAGRVLNTTSNWSDTTHPGTLFQGASSSSTCTNSSSGQYWAFGGLANAMFGPSLTFNRTYDARLRTSCELDTGTGSMPATPSSATVTIIGSEQTK